MTRRRLGVACCAAVAVAAAWTLAGPAEAAARRAPGFVGPLILPPSSSARQQQRGSRAVVVAPRPAVSLPSAAAYAAAAGDAEGEDARRQQQDGERRQRRSSSRKGDGKHRHFEFLKEVARNKKQAQRNKQRFRDNRDEYLEEMRKAFKLMQLKEREESGFQWVKRPKRERQIPLRELQLGRRYDGVVITVKEHGAYIDFGSTRDGFVRLRDFSDTDFILDARDVVKPGDEVAFYVKYVSAQEGIVTGSLVPSDVETEEDQEARTPLAEVQEDDELWGEVTKVSNYGAFVDVGVEVQGFLHIIYYPKRPQGALTQDVFYPGQRLRVWALEVDREKRRLKLTGERPRALPRVDYSWFLGGEDIDPYEGQRPEYPYESFSYEDGRGLQPRGRGKRAAERMQSWRLGGGDGGGERRGRFIEEDEDVGGYEGEGDEDEVVHDLDAARRAREEAEAAQEE